MASKLINSAIQPRLLQPSRLLQSSRLLIISSKIVRRNPGQLRSPPILSSRSYSESIPTPSLLNDSKSTPTSSLLNGSKSTRSSQFSSIVKDWARDNWSWKKILAAGGAIGVAVTTIVVYVTQVTWANLTEEYRKEHQRDGHKSARESKIYDTLVAGPKFRKEIENVIPRDTDVKQVKILITPSMGSRGYPLIIGEHGTGKTTLLQLAINSLEQPKGIVYVDVPNNPKSRVSFTKALQRALGWEPDLVLDSDKNLAEPSFDEAFDETWEAFFRAAAKYQDNYKKIPVLIIDNANRLAERQPELLDQIQDDAKKAADDGTATIVFVSSEGRLPNRMTMRSSWSRHEDILEIGDISKEEALKYLKLRKIDDKQAAQIYELVGGRMIHLKSITDRIQRGRTFQDLRLAMLADAQHELTSAGILRRGPYHKDGAKIIDALLKNGSISRNHYSSLVAPEIGDKLLETNAFALHFGSQQITFQSALVARYCEQNPDSWTVEK